MRRRLLAGAVAALALGLLLPIRSFAQSAVEWPEGVRHEDVAAIARDLNCPLCQGYSLQDCPLPVCAQMRTLIAERLADGATPQDIQAEFVAEYGPQVLNAPPAEGLGILVWVLPFAVLIAGLVVAGSVVRRAASGQPRRAAPEAYADRLEALLEDRR
jgi:cytochrome c-type biogenesis protein CcmH